LFISSRLSETPPPIVGSHSTICGATTAVLSDHWLN
jgi:hypothetical protein